MSLTWILRPFGDDSPISKPWFPGLGRTGFSPVTRQVRSENSRWNRWGYSMNWETNWKPTHEGMQRIHNMHADSCTKNFRVTLDSWNTRVATGIYKMAKYGEMYHASHQQYAIWTLLKSSLTGQDVNHESRPHVVFIHQQIPAHPKKNERRIQGGPKQGKHMA